jgi:hypothetical protein
LYYIWLEALCLHPHKVDVEYPNEMEAMISAVDVESPGEKELAVRVTNFVGETGSQLGPLTGLFDHITGVDSLEDALSTVLATGSISDLSDLIELANEKAFDLVNFQDVKHLSTTEASALLLYSMDSGFYQVLNATLRDQDRNALKPFVKAIWLLMTAVSKCPLPSKRHVYRGVNCDLSSQYPEGRRITWNSFSSCTTRLNTLENGTFMGKFGTRTLFSLELTTNRARSISACSFYKKEEEVLLPPNSRFIVESLFRSGDGLIIIHMKELVPLDPIIVFRDKEAVSNINSLNSSSSTVAETELSELRAEYQRMCAEKDCIIASMTRDRDEIIANVEMEQQVDPAVATSLAAPEYCQAVNVAYHPGSYLVWLGVRIETAAILHR